MPQSVLLLTTTEGHVSLAQAAGEALEQARISHHLQVFEEPALAIYRFYYRFAPFALEPTFRFLNSQVGMSISHKFLHWQNTGRIRAVLEKVKPQVIITTSWGFQPVLDRLQKQSGFSYLTIIANPRTPFQSEFSAVADTNLVFDETQWQMVHKKFPWADCQSLGWLVRSTFEATYDKQQVKKQLGVPSNQLVVLFQTGSEGTSAVLHVLKQVCQRIDTPVTIIVACGSNRRLLANVKEMQDSTNSQATLLPLPFTANLHQYMQAADLIVGKAGPNSIFEAVATLTPIMVTTHVAGQENGNLDLIRQYDIGWVEENTGRATKLILTLLANPQQLQSKQRQLVKMRAYNMQAKSNLVTLVKSLLTKKASSTRTC